MTLRTFIALFLAILIAAVGHGLMWEWLRDQGFAPDVRAVQSLSLSPFARNQNPMVDATVTLAQIANDIEVVAPVTNAIRTYSSTLGLETVPIEAVKRRGFRVVQGVWLSHDPVRDVREIENGVWLANNNKSVVALVVGNETLLREDKTVSELVAILRDLRKRVKANTQITTSETWDIWLKYPELAQNVDYINAHILPYWEGIPAEQAVTYAFEKYDELQATFPNKKIVIGEFGWPSQGYNQRDADPNPVDQARVLREFITEATRRGVEYNIIEAIDQPWKIAEGLVGAYWGLFNAQRQPKFSLQGLVETPNWRPKMIASLIVGAFLTVLGLARRRPTVGHALLYAFAANAMGAGIVSAAWWPFEAYMILSTWIMWGISVAAIIPLAAITLARIHEIAEVMLGRKPTRLFTPGLTPPSGKPLPMVSIQVPAYREPPAMLIETLNALAVLDYPDFEVLVIINNTPDEGFWRPIEDHCKTLGSRFKFLNFPSVTGFKAGALNLAMNDVDARAEILALIDADYVVNKNWLKDLIPVFEDPQVALMQAPQDHRNASDSAFHRMMQWEYAGFFDIGMVQRNEDNAIITHGTMLMIRRSAFEKVGGWQIDTIVEDTELGLRLYQAGYSAHYTNRRYGWGLLPDTFKAYKSQRHRWAYGALQIIRKHGRSMLPSSRTLTREQKFHFTTGWFFWLSDALGILIALLNLIWVPLVLTLDMMVPTVAMTVPILTAFSVNILHSQLLYRIRVKARFIDTLAAGIAAMSLQWTVAKAVFDGIVKESLAFVRTDKGAGAKKIRPGATFHALRETLLGTALAAAALTLHLLNEQEVMEVSFFAVTLAIQSIPLLSATLMHWIERLGPSPTKTDIA
jgi:exo-beta-1,3-glucanase (GH17 family)/cellulose synthase/poly-beta-1,6-N-acetylglucosamine synthase-like glycosyltransferase